MRVISAFFILVFITACNNAGEKKDDIKDTAKKVIQMPVSTIPDTIFTGSGTEPFWSVYVINQNKIVFHPADGADVEVPFVVASTIDSVTSKYNSSNSTSAIELTIVKKNCSDGMSDEVYPYAVALLVNKTAYNGCGRMGNESEAINRAFNFD